MWGGALGCRESAGRDGASALQDQLSQCELMQHGAARCPRDPQPGTLKRGLSSELDASCVSCPRCCGVSSTDLSPPCGLPCRCPLPSATPDFSFAPHGAPNRQGSHATHLAMPPCPASNMSRRVQKAGSVLGGTWKKGSIETHHHSPKPPEYHLNFSAMPSM
jgi:hypothetical protein